MNSYNILYSIAKCSTDMDIATSILQWFSLKSSESYLAILQLASTFSEIVDYSIPILQMQFMMLGDIWNKLEQMHECSSGLILLLQG